MNKHHIIQTMCLKTGYLSYKSTSIPSPHTSLTKRNKSYDYRYV